VHYLRLADCNIGDIVLKLGAKGLLESSMPQNSMSKVAKAICLKDKTTTFVIQLDISTVKASSIPYRRFEAKKDEVAAQLEIERDLLESILTKYHRPDFLLAMMEEAYFINGFIGEIANIFFNKEGCDSNFAQASNIAVCHLNDGFSIREMPNFYANTPDPLYGICYYPIDIMPYGVTVDDVYKCNQVGTEKTKRFTNHTLLQEKYDTEVLDRWFRLRTLFEKLSSLVAVPILLVPNYPFNAYTKGEKTNLSLESDEVTRLLENTRMINKIVFGVSRGGGTKDGAGPEFAAPFGAFSRSNAGG
jgi:hypothetical protein